MTMPRYELGVAGMTIVNRSDRRQRTNGTSRKCSPLCPYLSLSCNTSLTFTTPDEVFNFSKITSVETVPVAAAASSTKVRKASPPPGYC
jgi:hypothetical protein